MSAIPKKETGAAATAAEAEPAAATAAEEEPAAATAAEAEPAAEAAAVAPRWQPFIHFGADLNVINLQIKEMETKGIKVYYKANTKCSLEKEEIKIKCRQHSWKGSGVIREWGDLESVSVDAASVVESLAWPSTEKASETNVDEWIDGIDCGKKEKGWEKESNDKSCGGGSFNIMGVGGRLITPLVAISRRRVLDWGEGGEEDEVNAVKKKPTHRGILFVGFALKNGKLILSGGEWRHSKTPSFIIKGTSDNVNSHLVDEFIKNMKNFVFNVGVAVATSIIDGWGSSPFRTVANPFHTNTVMLMKEMMKLDKEGVRTEAIVHEDVQVSGGKEAGGVADGDGGDSGGEEAGGVADGGGGDSVAEDNSTSVGEKLSTIVAGDKFSSKIVSDATAEILFGIIVEGGEGGGDNAKTKAVFRSYYTNHLKRFVFYQKGGVGSFVLNTAGINHGDPEKKDIKKKFLEAAERQESSKEEEEWSGVLHKKGGGIKGSMAMWNKYYFEISGEKLLYFTDSKKKKTKRLFCGGVIL